jgi:hypothetical protein
MYMRRESKSNLIVFVSTLVLAIVLFFLVDLFTLKYRGEGYGISGNGNLVLLFVFPAVPVYLFMLVFVYKVGGSYYRHIKNIAILPAFLVLLLCICIYGEYYLTQSLIRHLKGGPNTPDSVIYRFGWLNQYTNTLFFNVFTFTIGVLLALLISSCVEILRRRKIKHTQQL